MKIFVDLDGVLVNFVKGMCDAHEVPYPCHTKPEHMGNWELEGILGLSTIDFWKPANDPEFWINLEWMEDYGDMWDSIFLGKEHGDVCFMTSPSLHPNATAGKISWIQKHIPQELQRQYAIAPKKHFFAHPNAVLIDDYDENVNKFREHGGKAILVPRLWNSMHDVSKHSSDYVFSQLDRLLHDK